MIETIVIRDAEVSDVKNLTVLQQQVWISTYATEGIRSEFSEYVLAEFTPEKMHASLDDPQRILLVAILDDHLVGYVEIGLNRPCPVGDISAPEIMTLYVLERFAGKGIGSQLMNAAEHRLSEGGYRSVWLDAYHENGRAIAFYERRNFVRIGTASFEETGQRYLNIVFLKTLA